MLSVAEAQTLVLAQAQPLPAERTSVSPSVLGRVLAEDVCSDLDMPPFDKAMMDGYALRTADLAGRRAELQVIEEVMAGQTPRKALAPGQATRIMTGAPVPAGADAVVMIERTRSLEGARVEVEDPSLKAAKNIAKQGVEMRRGERVLEAGSVLRPQELGLLAIVGQTALRTYPAPEVAVLSTGDELVDASQVPGSGQIRNSNGPLLMAQVRRAGGNPRYLGIARDQPEQLQAKIADGLRSPVLVLSGGVSAGKLDLVPGVLQELGVRAHFHKVAMKPGKPVFFGTRARDEGPTTLVFGLPGNPVSAFVCFELFVRPSIRRLAGHRDTGPHWVQATLVEDFDYDTDRPTYFPARLTDEDGWRVRPVPWLGSPDLRGLTRANALVLLPPGNLRHPAGQRFPVMVVEG